MPSRRPRSQSWSWSQQPGIGPGAGDRRTGQQRRWRDRERFQQQRGVLRALALVTALALGASQSSWAAESPAQSPKPKYGPEATRLSLSHEYFRKAAAPDFWAMMPYYTAQQDDSACSIASMAMVMNGLRAKKDLTANDELISQKELVSKVKGDGWSAALGTAPKGVTLDQLGEIARAALKQWGMEGTVEVVHADKNDASTLKRLRESLVRNERSADDLIIANYLQGVLTGDAEVGHIAPIGAYDAAKKRVLILDPDRKWYEPYWASDQAFLSSMATKDKVSDKNRGWIHITVTKR
jgi:hypothetical protein